MATKAIFLDRDGTIIIDKGYQYKIEDIEYIDGALDGLRKLQEMGYILVVITNQSGIARGLFSEAEYSAFEDWLNKDLSKKSISISAFYYCPHLENGIVPKYSVKCDCRKPGTKLFWMAQQRFDIDMGKSYAIGDRITDLCICKESNVEGIILDVGGTYTHVGNEIVLSNWDDICEYVKKGLTAI